MDYIFACKNNGNCRDKMLWDQLGIIIEHKLGSFRIETDSGVYHYRCCTGCHLPFSRAESEKINKILGLKLSDIKIDDDLLELLNAIE